MRVVFCERRRRHLMAVVAQVGRDSLPSASAGRYFLPGE
jgi:hypothetical protein